MANIGQINISPADFSLDRKAFSDVIWQQAKGIWPENDLSRIKRALSYWSGDVQPNAHFEQDTKGFYLPDIPDEPWLNPYHYEASSILLENYQDILREATSLIDGSIQAPPYGLADDAPANSAPTPGRPKNWKEWRLASMNKLIDARCEKFPATTSALQKIFEQTPFLMSAKFMILGSGEETLLHSDFNNIFVNIWLNLIAPPNSCFLEMRGKACRPEPGTILAFNHSYLHKAYNHGSCDRVILCISHFHHNLTSVEQEVFSLLTPVFRNYVELNSDDVLQTA